MKNIYRLSENGGCARKAYSALSLVVLLLLFPGFSQSQTNTADAKSSLKPWVGVWTFNDDAALKVVGDSNQKTIVEIMPLSDGKGLEITRKEATQPEVKEWLVLDGTKRPVDASNCTGWQTARWIPEAGIIFSSSEMNCKEAGAFSTSNLKIIVAADKMVDILSLKSGGQTKLATRRLVLERELVPAGGSEPAYANTVERIAAAAPWKLDRIVQLSKTMDTQLLEAALVEKNVTLDLNSAAAIKDLNKTKLPNEVIDLLVALAFPDKFHIERNGKVELKPWIASSSSSGSVRNSYSNTALPGVTSYYQGLFYNCNGFGYAGYNPYGYGYNGYGSLFSPGSCWSLYSPFWYDYRIYVPVNRSYPDGTGGGSGGQGTPAPSSAARVDAVGGYIQIEPQTSNHRAKPRDGNTNYPNSSRSSGQTNVYNSSSGSAVSASSSGGGSSSSASSTAAPAASSSSGASVSPGGYSSGGASTGHTAVSR
jgi:hypothetical protein